MSDALTQARGFVEACDGGKGWDVCRKFCHSDATFSVQADALAEMKTLEEYTGWTQGLLTPLPDATCPIKFLAEDPDHNTVVAVATFQGTHTGPEGPVDPTGKAVASEYVYIMEFEDGKIRHMTKIWNDAIALRQLGWT